MILNFEYSIYWFCSSMFGPWKMALAKPSTRFSLKKLIKRKTAQPCLESGIQEQKAQRKNNSLWEWLARETCPANPKLLTRPQGNAQGESWLTETRILGVRFGFWNAGWAAPGAGAVKSNSVHSPIRRQSSMKEEADSSKSEMDGKNSKSMYPRKDLK